MSRTLPALSLAVQPRIVNALLAAGLSPWDAARLAVWLHGRAGDLGARRCGWAPLIATDVLASLVDAIRDLEVRA